MKAIARAPGTCGELAQGIINNQFFHITFPMSLWVSAEVYTKPGSGLVSGLEQRHKSFQAACQLLMRHPCDYLDFNIKLNNLLLPGKGMASSTADMAAVVQAMAFCYGKTLTPWQIGEILLAVEPSDGLFFPGIAIFDHRHGTFGRSLTVHPDFELSMLVVDTGGYVDTEEFNQRPEIVQMNKAKEKQVRAAFRDIIQGLRQGKADLVGRGATTSSLANQQMLPKAGLEELIAQALNSGAIGVNVAHSGTVLGILYAGNYENPPEQMIQWLKVYRPQWTLLGFYKMVDGGVSVEGCLGEGTGIAAYGANNPEPWRQRLALGQATRAKA